MFGEIAHHQAELRGWSLGADAGADALKPGRATRSVKVGVVDDRETEIAPVTGVREPGAAGPEPKRERRASAQAQPFAAVKLGNFDFVFAHLRLHFGCIMSRPRAREKLFRPFTFFRAVLSNVSTHHHAL